MPQKVITIFGSGVAKEGSKNWREAEKIGSFLATAGFTVANGGYGGAMFASAKGAKEADGKTIGITTDQFKNVSKNQFIDKEIRLPTWRERLFRLIEMGDGFVVLDGGTGTLTELVVVWEMLNKQFHLKPIVILGRWIQKAVQTLKQNPEIKMHRELYFAETPGEAVQYLTEKLAGTS